MAVTMTACNRLCGGDVKRKVRVDVWDQDSVSSADQIGLAEFPVECLLKKESITLIDYKVRLGGCGMEGF